MGTFGGPRSGSGGSGAANSLDWAIDKSTQGNDLQFHTITEGVALFGVANGYTSRVWPAGASVSEIGILHVPNAPTLEGFTSLSWCGWIELTEMTKDRCIVSAPRGTIWSGSEAQFQLFVQSTGELRIRLNDAATTFLSTDKITLSTITHVGFTWDGSNVRLYLDGVEDSGGAQAYVHGVLNGSNGDNGIVMGDRSATNPSATNEWIGRQQDVALFKNRTLTGADFTAIFAEQDPAGAGAQRNLNEFFDLTDCVLNLRM